MLLLVVLLSGMPQAVRANWDDPLPDPPLTAEEAKLVFDHLPPPSALPPLEKGTLDLTDKWITDPENPWYKVALSIFAEEAFKRKRRGLPAEYKFRLYAVNMLHTEFPQLIVGMFGPGVAYSSINGPTHFIFHYIEKDKKWVKIGDILSTGKIDIMVEDNQKVVIISPTDGSWVWSGFRFDRGSK
ncbi:MAG: hypothetical protein ACOYK8_07500 [Alphaproteobacteria bacterium]